MVISGVQAEVFMFILARMIGVFTLAPIFQSRALFQLGKLTIAIWITIVLWFVIPIPADLPATSITIGVALVIEYLIGLFIGFIIDILFTSVEFGGHLIDSQMGLSAAQTLDPMSGIQTTIMAKLLRWVALMIFFTIDGHHMMLVSLEESFRQLPIAQTVYFAGTMDQFVRFGGMIFAIGFQIASPIILVIFFLDFALGLISRVAPQVNVFQLGFEVKPTLGTFTFIIMTPFFITYLVKFLSDNTEEVLRLFVGLQ